MEQESFKRAASTSPVGDPNRKAKRPRFATDIWSEEEHLRQDEIVKKSLVKANGSPLEIILYDEFSMAFLLQSVGNAILQGRLPHLFHVSSFTASYAEALKNDPELMISVVNSYTSGSYNDVRCLELFRKRPISTEPSHHILPTYGQKTAVEQSWMREFSGDTAHALWKKIKIYYNSRFHAHYTAIVQSSGMGKSRTVDELAKHHFVIPLNLRGPNSKGYPPADDDVRDFLIVRDQQVLVHNRARAFLCALFEHTATTVRNEFNSIDIANIASQFRTRMTEGQTIRRPNAFRTKFYRDVIRSARRKVDAYSFSSNLNGNEDGFDPARACEELITLLSNGQQDTPTSSGLGDCSDGGDQCQTAAANTKNEDPLIILAFDEAHTLTERKATTIPQWSNLSELQYVLLTLHHLSCFTLFMSKAGRISQFPSAPKEDSSFKMISNIFAPTNPFTDLGFDTLAHKISLKNLYELEQLASNDHMAHLGRPLFGSLYYTGDESLRQDIVIFAKAKLLNTDRIVKELSDEQRLACLCQRFPLEFNSTTYSTQEMERKQVEGHMRVCMNIDPTIERMVTASASEPLLSEAAYSIMAETSFNVPRAMKSILEGFSIHQGNHGELLTMLLFTIARDNTVGPPNEFDTPEVSRVFDVAPFLSKNLFKDPPELQTLITDFPEGIMHFNHYIKVHELAVINAESLLLLSSRGAGVLCGNGQCAIDGINPFLCKDTTLEIENLGLILWQSKNDPAFTSTVWPTLFTAMDVYKLGILKEGGAAVPLVKIVFALAARTPSLKVVRHAPSTEYNAVIYEIWCAGISPSILNAVEPLQESVWSELLDASYGWKRVYEGHDVDNDLRRSINPGAARDIDHWSQWTGRNDDQVESGGRAVRL